MTTWSPFGERSLTLVAASFPDRQRARAAAESLRHDSELDGEVAIVGPEDPQPTRKFEPEQTGIWRTLLRAHLILGAAGLALGALVAVGLVMSGWPAASHSPWFVLLFLSVMGAFVGMMAGGLLTLRPDHAIVIRAMREALRRREWAVVVRPLSREQVHAAMAGLEHAGAQPLRSL